MTKEADEERGGAPAGIGGWLILAAMVTCGFAFARVFSLALLLVPDPERSAIASSSILLSLLFSPYANAVLALCWIFAVIFLFRKNAIFPKFVVGLIIIETLLTAIAISSITVTIPEAPGLLGPAAGLPLVLVYNGIWIWYILASKRVRNTLVQRLRTQ